MTAMMHHELVHKLIIIPRHKLLYTINDQGNLKKWANTKKTDIEELILISIA